jgi:dipeptidyl aminopeptidase/acylaminoacyl peptidase/peroxiredoxin
LRGVAYSQNGEWVAYQIEPVFGDGELIVRQTTGDVEHRRALASGARFSADSRYLAFTVGKSKIEAREKEIAALRKRGKNQEKSEAGSGRTGGFARRGTGRRASSATPPATTSRGRRRGGRGGRFGRGGGGGGNNNGSSGGGDLFVLDLQTGKVESIGKVSRWTMPGDANYLLYQMGSTDGDEGTDNGDRGAGAPEGAAGGRRGGGRRGAPGAGGRSGGRGAGRAGPAGRGGSSAPRRPSGSELVIRDLATAKERKLKDVVSYGYSRKAAVLWYHTSVREVAKDKKDKSEDAGHGLFVQLPNGDNNRQLLKGIANVSSVTFSRDEKQIAFLSDKVEFGDSKAKNDLYLWSMSRDLSHDEDGTAKRIAYVGAAGMPPTMRVSGSPSFTREGNALSFSVTSPPKPAALPILDEDQVDLDLWSYRDGLLQTMQASGRGRSGSSALTAVYWCNDNKIVVVGDERMPSLRFMGTNGAYMTGSYSKPYEAEVQWDGRYSDQWLINARTGERTQVLEKHRGRVSSSPGGKYLMWFDKDYHWISMNVATGERRDLTGNLHVPFHRWDDDHPSPDSAYGVAGWAENDSAVLIYDEYDVWKVSPKSGRAVCVTDGYGREHRLQLRLQRLPGPDDSIWVADEMMLSARDLESMATGFYADSLRRSQKPAKLWMVDKAISGLTRPPKSTRLFFNLSTFREYGDLWTAKADFTGHKKLTDVNPQQDEYRWGNAELVNWTDGNGDKRTGVLVKPDGFDPQKKYPMMVYFYEKLSQNLHRYVAPTPGTSPNAAYYVSNGYLWFMPDIVYEIGYPGPSCVKCVVSGVQHLIQQGFVDKDAVGAAGHSWGGYQTAFLVTRTNIFKAVESGAPVSNMLSAYGGIRYDSGMSRQFQYEQTQSRIGGTPWEYPLRYTENSPIHFADRVQTPVLILHNDKDGAVPWTQGIEYFVALKRLGKEAYLFNYNGEPHGLRKAANKRDWTRRMAEYFDHHLRGAKVPDWMTEGVPYRERAAEKLPYAKSYIDAHVNPSEKLLAAEAADESKAKKRAEDREKERLLAAAAEANGLVNAKPEEAAAPAKAASSAGSVLIEGKDAPSFALLDEADVEHQLADYRGQKLLIWFYPKADTPGCTAQGCGLRDEFAQFEQQGVAVLGVSFDDARANTAFRDKNNFPFPLLCDTSRLMAVAYGAADDQKSSYARRIAVLIDEEGKVVKAWDRVNPRTFATEALAALPQSQR